MSAADDVAAYLVAQSHASAVGTDIFVNQLPDTPDEAISVYDTPGLESDQAFNDGSAGEAVLIHPAVQVRKRHTDGDDAMDDALGIFNELDGLGKATLNSVDYEYIKANHMPYLLEIDEKRRPVVVCNYQLTR